MSTSGWSEIYKVEDACTAENAHNKMGYDVKINKIGFDGTTIHVLLETFQLQLVEWGKKGPLKRLI